jgi:hypothetical protein
VADGTRTRDHRDHNPGLYQLSYRHHVPTEDTVQHDPGPVAQRIERWTSNPRAEVRLLPGPSPLALILCGLGPISAGGGAGVSQRCPNEIGEER